MMKRKLVIIGGGFAGINLIKELKKYPEFEVVLVDKNNYNYFTPLIYQVATGFIEPSSISYPYRSFLSNKKNIRFWLGSLVKIVPDKNKVILSNTEIIYDKLIIGTGTQANYFGLDNVRTHGIPMNSLNDALDMRNLLLQRMEKACQMVEVEIRKEWLSVVIAGGGPTGVEIAGMLAELEKYIIDREYPELSNAKAHIYLVNSGDSLLKGMSEKSKDFALKQLRKLGVEILLNTRVQDFNGEEVMLNNGNTIRCRNLIWATGVEGRKHNGLPESCYGNGKRLLVNQFHQLKDYLNIYAVGDCSLLSDDPDFPQGHPQLAPVAVQQGINLARNLVAELKGEKLTPFLYKNKGEMAIIGKSNAVADINKKIHFKGFVALMAWGFIHVFALISRLDRLRTFFNWGVSYITKNEDLRMIIRPKDEMDKRNAK